MNTIARTMTHTMICEWYYVERFEGREVPAYAQWPIQDEKPPSFEIIERTWREQAPRTRAMFAAERDWTRPISWLSFPDDHGKRFHIHATSGDFVMQMSFHEIHHRAQVMAKMGVA